MDRAGDQPVRLGLAVAPLDESTTARLVAGTDDDLSACIEVGPVRVDDRARMAFEQSRRPQFATDVLAHRLQLCSQAAIEDDRAAMIEPVRQLAHSVDECTIGRPEQTKRSSALTGIQIELEAPYLVFLGDVGDDGHAKTGFGLVHWRRERCAGQMRLPGCPVDLGIPELDVAGAIEAGVRTAIVGVAPTGGQIVAEWTPPLLELARSGIDLAAGMHSRLRDIPEFVEAATEGGAKLIDVRVPPKDIPVARGRQRSGKRVLTVGTDCAVGKKYSALALHRELAARGVASTFRATGQTGIMISGSGIPIDAVVSDFVSGAAEILSPDNRVDHWDVIEGQGSLLHPSYAGVSLGLLHGSQPDALVLCHDAGRSEILGLEGTFPVPPINDVINVVTRLAHVTNPASRCIGISVNTSRMSDGERSNYLQRLEHEAGLPCVDPIATGMDRIADELLTI